MAWCGNVVPKLNDWDAKLQQKWWLMKCMAESWLHHGDGCETMSLVGIKHATWHFSAGFFNYKSFPSTGQLLNGGWNAAPLGPKTFQNGPIIWRPVWKGRRIARITWSTAISAIAYSIHGKFHWGPWCFAVIPHHPKRLEGANGGTQKHYRCTPQHTWLEAEKPKGMTIQAMYSPENHRTKWKFIAGKKIIYCHPWWPG